MRQVVTMARAVRKRKDTDWYRNFCTQASLAGRKVEQSFDEVFPEYTCGQGEEEAVAIDPKTAKLMEELAQKQLARLETEHGKRK